LSLEQYASPRSDLAIGQTSAGVILSRYGVDPSLWVAVDASWKRAWERTRTRVIGSISAFESSRLSCRAWGADRRGRWKPRMTRRDRPAPLTEDRVDPPAVERWTDGVGTGPPLHDNRR
jgi:hypothetical protein